MSAFVIDSIYRIKMTTKLQNAFRKRSVQNFHSRKSKSLELSV